MKMLLLVALGVESATASTILWSEDFSNGLSGITLTDRSGNPEKLFSDGGKDYICIYGNDNAADYSKGSGCPRAVTNSPNWTPLKNEESSFLAFEDTDSEGAGIPLTFTWSDIEVAGASELTFSGKFYNSDTSSMMWDKNDYVKLTAVQGSTETELVHITMDPSHEDNYNAHPYDIAQSPALKLESKIVNTISKTFAVTSEPLTLKLEINVNAEEEEMGIAALSLVGAPTPIVAALPTTEPTEPGCYFFEQHGYTGSDATKAADWSCKQSDSAWKKDSWGMSQGISTSHHGCFITRKNQISNWCGTTPVMKFIPSVAPLPTTEPTEPGCYLFEQHGYTGSDATKAADWSCKQSDSAWKKDSWGMSQDISTTKDGCFGERKNQISNWCGTTPVMKWVAALPTTEPTEPGCYFFEQHGYTGSDATKAAKWSCKQSDSAWKKDSWGMSQDISTSHHGCFITRKNQISNLCGTTPVMKFIPSVAPLPTTEPTEPGCYLFEQHGYTGSDATKAADWSCKQSDSAWKKDSWGMSQDISTTKDGCFGERKNQISNWCGTTPVMKWVAALPTTEPTEPGCYFFEQHGYTGSDATKAAKWSCKQSDSAWKKDSWGMSQGISTSHHGCFITRKNQISNLCGTTPVMKWVAALPTTEPTEPGCYTFQQYGYTGSDAKFLGRTGKHCAQSRSIWNKDNNAMASTKEGCLIDRKANLVNWCGATPVMKWVAALPTTEPTEPGCYTFQQYGYTGSDAKFLGRTGKHCAQSRSIWNKDNNAMASTKEGCLIDRKANLVNWCGATPVMKWIEEKCWRKMPTGCNSVLTDAGSDGNGLEWFVDSNAADEDGCEARETYYNDYCGKIHSALSHWGVDTSDHVPPPVESIDVEMSVMNETVATFTEDKQRALRNEIARELEVSADDIIITIGRIPNKISRRLTASDPDLEWLFITITLKLQPGTATQEVDKLEAPEFADNIAAATGIITEFEQFKPQHGSSICATCKWLAKEGSTHGHVKVTHYLNSQAYGEMGLQHKCFHSVDGTCKCMCTGEPVDDIPYRNGEEKHGRLADGPEEGVPGFSFHPGN